MVNPLHKLFPRNQDWPIWKPFAVHGLYLSFSSFLFRLAKLIVQVIGARALSSRSFGLFSYVHALVEIFQNLFGGGIDTVAARSYGKGEAWKQSWWGGILLKAFLSLLGSLIGLLLIPFPYNLLFILWYIFSMQGRLWYAYSNALLASKAILVSGFVAEAVLLLAAIIGVKILGLGGLILAFVLERLTEWAVLTLAVVIREPHLLRAEEVRGALSASQEILRMAIPLWITQGLFILYSRLDAVLVKQLLGYEELAFYALTYRVAEAPLFLFGAIADSSLAFFIRQKEEMLESYGKITKNMLGIGFLLVAALHLFGYFGAVLIFSERYVGIEPLIGAYSWSIMFMGVNMVTTNYLLAQSKEKVFPRIALQVLGVNLLGNFALIPRLGAMAPCLVTVLTEGVNFVLQRREARGSFRWDIAIAGAVVAGAILSGYLLSVGIEVR